MHTVGERGRDGVRQVGPAKALWAPWRRGTSVTSLMDRRCAGKALLGSGLSSLQGVQCAAPGPSASRSRAGSRLSAVAQTQCLE